MDVIILPLLQLILVAIKLYVWALIIYVVMSWLVSFNVVNTNNRFVYVVGEFLHRITQPALGPIRRVVPNMGGIDLSPLLLILLLFFLEGVVRQLAFRFM